MQPNGKHDVWSHRIAIGGTILVLALAIFFIGYLAANGDDIPPTLTAVALTGFTAITAMLHAIMTKQEKDVAQPPAPTSTSGSPDFHI